MKIKTATLPDQPSPRVGTKALGTPTTMILRCLSSGGALAELQLQRAVHLNRKKFRAALGSLCNDGQVVRMGRGSKGNPYAYSLPSRELEREWAMPQPADVAGIVVPTDTLVPVKPPAGILVPSDPPIGGIHFPATDTTPAEMLVPGVSQHAEVIVPDETDVSQSESCIDGAHPTAGEPGNPCVEDELVRIPADFILTKWELRPPPVPVEAFMTVTNTTAFVGSTFRQLAALVRGDSWGAGNWPLPVLLRRLQAVGVHVVPCDAGESR